MLYSVAWQPNFDKLNLAMRGVVVSWGWSNGSGWQQNTNSCTTEYWGHSTMPLMSGTIVQLRIIIIIVNIVVAR